LLNKGNALFETKNPKRGISVKNDGGKDRKGGFLMKKILVLCKEAFKLLGIAIIFALTIIGCNGLSDTHSHQWGKWQTTTVPTCTTAGVETKICSSCKRTETRAVAELGHTWGVWMETTVPTEDDDGEEKRYCSHDPSHTETRSIDALIHTHDWGDWKQTFAPTCTTAGVENRYCSHNEEHTDTRSIAIDVNAHNFGNWTQTTAPTCSTAGIETGTCSHNEEHTDTRPIAIDVNAHNFGNWTQTTAPTCTTAGIETGTCSHDQTHTATRIGANIDSNAHDYQWVTIAPSFIEEGMDREVCSRCADENGNTRNIVSALLITTTEEWGSALTQLNGKTGSYTLTISGNIAVTEGTASYINRSSGFLSVTLQGSGKLYLARRGSIIAVGDGQTLIIDSVDLILEGLTNGKNGASQDNNGAVVNVSGGKLELRNGTIRDNTSSSYGGVYIYGGTFVMSGGKISGNTSNGYGGGVTVLRYGAFIMGGGEISGNTTINSGSSSAPDYGGGGGGVYVRGTSRNGSTGSITVGDAYFNKTGGTITGYGSDQVNGNVVKNSSGTVVGFRGHAVWATAYDMSSNNTITEFKQTTAGTGVNLFFNGSNCTFDGGWDS
jgi:hypothetical protein